MSRSCSQHPSGSLSQEARERWQETRESRHPAAHLRGYSGQTAKRWLSTFFLLAAAWPRKKNGLLEPLKNKAFRKVPFLKLRPTFETQKKERNNLFWAWLRPCENSLLLFNLKKNKKQPSLGFFLDPTFRKPENFANRS